MIIQLCEPPPQHRNEKSGGGNVFFFCVALDDKFFDILCQASYSLFLSDVYGIGTRPDEREQLVLIPVNEGVFGFCTSAIGNDIFFHIMIISRSVIL